MRSSAGGRGKLAYVYTDTTRTSSIGMSKEAGIFISYKSENANEARSVAEVLLAQGVQVWFSEYEITLQDFDDDNRIMGKIESAVENSFAAIVFTNDRWTGSKYCRAEMRAIEKRLLPQSIVEVCIPPEASARAEFSILQNVAEAGSWIEWADNPREIATFVLERVSQVSTLDLAHATNLSPPEVSIMGMRFGLSLDVGSLKSGRTFWSKSDGHFPAQMYLFEGSVRGRKVGLLVGINPFRTAIAGTSFSQTKAFDDRAIYRAYRRYAEWWLRLNDYTAKGVHLHFWNTRSQLAISLQHSPPSPAVCFWERHYALLLSDPCSEFVGEATLTFHVELERNEFSAFCELTREFDRIALTCRYEPLTALRNEGWAAWMFRLGTYCVVPFVVSFTGFSGLPSGIKCTVVGVCSFLAADLTYGLVSRRARLLAAAFTFQFGPRGALQMLGWLAWVLHLVSCILDHQKLLLVISICAFVCGHESLYVWGAVGSALAAGAISRRIIHQRREAGPIARAATYIQNWPQLKLDGTLSELSPNVISALGDQRMLMVLSGGILRYSILCIAISTVALSVGWSELGSVLLGVLLMLFFGTRAWQQVKRMTHVSLDLLLLIGKAEKDVTGEFAHAVSNMWIQGALPNDPNTLLGAIQWAAFACESDPRSWRNLFSLAEAFSMLARVQSEHRRLAFTEAQSATLKQAERDLAKAALSRAPDILSKSNAEKLLSQIL